MNLLHKTMLTAALVAGCFACTSDKQVDSQPPPYATDTAIPRPQPYAEGILTTVNGLAFEPDGRTLYVSHWVDEVDLRGKRRVRIFEHQFVDGQWSAPVPVAFSAEYTDYQPVLSPDGTRLYFTSTRPIPGTGSESRQNIWYVDRTVAGWSEPRIIMELATSGWDGYAVPVRTGRLYFISDRPGGAGAVDIWVAEPQSDGRYGEPVNVANVNSEHSDSDLFVDADERFMIFHRYQDATGTIDLWISFRAGDQWQMPRPLDETNGEGWELSPTVTPEGQYFFFNRSGILQQVDFSALIRAEEQEFLRRS